MLNTLLALTAASEFDEYGGLVLDGVEWERGGRGCTLRFRVWPSGAPYDPELDEEFEPAPVSPPELWAVECTDVRAARIMKEYVGDLSLTRDHILLAPYEQGHVQLAFRGRPRDSGALLAALWARHLAVAGDWIPFGEYLNLFDRSAPLLALLATGGGMLGDGPRPLMEAYADVLAEHGLDPSLVGGYRLGRMDGEAPDFAALTFGRSYVLGSGFTARRHDAG